MTAYKPLRELATLDDVTQWAAHLDESRPHRQRVIGHICDLVGQAPGPQVVELCSGPGRLAQALLCTHHHLHYTGFDYSPLLIEFAAGELAAHGDRLTLQQADLNQDQWLSQAPRPLHAVVSMQSLHDLGGEPEVSRIYQLVRELLAPGGLLINADLTVPEDAPMADNPGRLPLARHLALLQGYGFQDVRCTLQVDDIICVVGRV